MMDYSIIYKKVRHGYARLSQDGKLVITIPIFLKNDEKFKQSLIDKGEILLSKHKKREHIQVISENHIFMFGEEVDISEFNFKNKKHLEKYLKEALYEYTKPIVEKYSDLIGYSYKEIIIKKLKTKRGSCSHDQVITFNRDLVHLSTKYIKYVVIHEICHLKIKNHGSKFRDLVNKYCPDYKKFRKELRNIIIKH